MSTRSLTLSEFLLLSRIRPEELLGMLERGELPVTLSESHQVLIPADSLPTKLDSPRPLAAATLSSEQRASLESFISSVVQQELEPILDDVVNMVHRWEKRQPGIERENTTNGKSIAHTNGKPTQS